MLNIKATAPYEPGSQKQITAYSYDTMFALRDHENLIHTQQSTAAAKPLNQGIRALQPKTPGNLKTPFGNSKNDENKPVIFQGQKTLLRDGASKLDKNTFVTPAAPRNRAPLGAKTTNAKAQTFKTPSLAQQTVKKDKTVKRPSTARRSGRSKITVARTESVQVKSPDTDISEDEPDFGYAPPPIPDLLDLPPDVDLDQTFPQFAPENRFRGYGDIFHGSPKDENGFSIRLRKEEEEYRQFQEKRQRDLAVQIEQSRRAKVTDADEEVEAMIAAGPQDLKSSKVPESRVDSIKAKSAAAALSETSSRLPSVAHKQTASSRAKHVSQDHSNKTATSHMVNHRPTTLHSVSKNTIGFPKAKKTPSIIPSGQQLKNERAKRSVTRQQDIKPADFVALYGEPPFESEMWYRLRQEERLDRQLRECTIEEDDLASDFFETGFLSLNAGSDENEDDVFQLPMPED